MYPLIDAGPCCMGLVAYHLYPRGVRIRSVLYPLATIEFITC